MGNRNRSNVLLVEILIAVLFFMLSATVLVQVFGTSRNMTVRAGIETQALAEAQNVAEALYAADDQEAQLDELGFISYHGAWTRDYGDFTLYVNGETAPAGADEMWNGEVRAYYRDPGATDVRQADQELFTLPCSLYKGVRS